MDAIYGKLEVLYTILGQSVSMGRTEYEISSNTCIFNSRTYFMQYLNKKRSSTLYNNLGCLAN